MVFDTVTICPGLPITVPVYTFCPDIIINHYPFLPKDPGSGGKLHVYPSCGTFLTLRCPFPYRLGGLPHSCLSGRTLGFTKEDRQKRWTSPCIFRNYKIRYCVSRSCILCVLTSFLSILCVAVFSTLLTCIKCPREVKQCHYKNIFI